MPHKTTLVRPLATSSERRILSSSTRATLLLAASTQPRRIADSDSASFPQRVWSFENRREATLSLTSSGTNFATASETRPACETFRVI